MKAYKGFICVVAAIGVQWATAEPLGFQWPEQRQIDPAPFAAVFDQVFPLEASQVRNESDPALHQCDLNNEQQWQAAGLTPAAMDAINPAAHLPEAAEGLTSKRVAIQVRSSRTGCDILQNQDYLTGIPDSEKVFFSTRHFQQPLHIAVRYETGTRKKQRPTRSDNTVVIQHLPTGISHYPWAVRTWRQSTVTGSYVARMTTATLLFDDVSEQAAQRSLQLEQSYDNRGARVSASSVKLRWQDSGHQHIRIWLAGDLLYSYRDGQRHGLNFLGLSPVDYSVQYDCYFNGEPLDYYRVINHYDCQRAEGTEFGRDGVFRSYALARAAARAEALAAMAAPAAQRNGAATGAAEECIKAYTAARLCQQIPADPFGIARGICTSSVKSKFGGSDCKLPF